jgi:hypothetical protein
VPLMIGNVDGARLLIGIWLNALLIVERGKTLLS